jgi:deazaflavin-dependent oxidoreductase (nitroreductase family)
MPLEGTYQPSTLSFAAEQVELYELSGGTDGLEKHGQPCVILWTRGRKSGSLRKTPLLRIKRGDQYAVVASKGGARTNPLWYLNIVAHPNVTLQDGPEVKDFTARVVTGDERAEWWKAATEVWPTYDEYQMKTERHIPVVVLDPRT